MTFQVGHKQFNSGRTWFKKGHKSSAGMLGKKHSEETKNKMSQIRKGKKLTEEHKKNLSFPKPWAGHYDHTGMKKGHLVSEETRRKIGEKNSVLLTGRKFSPERRKRMSDVRIGKMPKNIMRPGKFMNIQRGWFDTKGGKRFFRSKWEANYALYLDFLIEQRQIKKWEYEVDTFIFEKIRFGTRSFRPDFKITKNNGDVEYHEVKGWMDSKSKTKLNRMRIYYPNVKIILIDRKAYEEIKNKVGRMINFN